MLPKARQFARSRWPLLVAAAGCALVRACALGAPAEASVEGVARMLSEATGGAVAPDAFAWEPSRGTLADAFSGRRLLFLSADDQGRRDVYRARVSVTPEGSPVRVLSSTNLTHTEFADEVGLGVVGNHGAFATVHDHQVVAVTSLQLDAMPPHPDDGPLESTLRSLLASFDAGSWGGIGRTHRSLSLPAVDIVLTDSELRLSTAQTRGQQVSSAEPWTQLVGGRGAARLSAQLVERIFERRPHRAFAGVITSDVDSTKEPAESSANWPLAPLAPLVAEAGPQQGKWAAVGAAPPGEPSLFYKTQLRLPVGNRGRLQLVAMDTRRLALRMQGGYALPAGRSGPAGAGSIPQRQLPRLAGAFNGAGAAAAAGLVVQGREIGPAAFGRASVVVTESDEVGLGLWPKATPMLEVASLRQMALPLVVGGRAGIGAERLDIPGERSALCRWSGGGLVYAWASATTWRDLAEALAQLGCEFAGALAATPDPTGFSVLQQVGDAATATAVDESEGPPALTLGPSEQDFFYLLRRDTLPGDEDLAWVPSPGAQPQPSFVPGLFQSRASAGSLNVELFSVEAGRVDWEVVGGSGEPLFEGRPAPRRELSPEDAQRALFALSLGHSTRATRYGLAFGDRQTIALRRVYATLVLKRGTAEIIEEGTAVTPQEGAQYVQLPQLVKNAEPTPRAVQTGGHRRRGALCVLPSGRLLAAFVEHDTSAPLALLLTSHGCSTVLALDRASQHDARLLRAGTDRPVPVAGETSLLVGLDREMSQQTFIFGTNTVGTAVSPGEPPEDSPHR